GSSAIKRSGSSKLRRHAEVSRRHGGLQGVTSGIRKNRAALFRIPDVTPWRFPMGVRYPVYTHR
ncbi:MAG: hypothetical protein WCH98_22515, partial [Verrucomicrobiota bacterium]